MSVLSLTKCLTGQHKPVRRNVVWKDDAYTGECRHCGKVIRRVAHKRWRAAKS